MNIEALKLQLVKHEGERLKLYRDSVGKWTIGVGHNIEDKGISERISRLMLEEDIEEHLALLDKYCPWWRQMSETRQLALADMAFNLGVGPSAEDPHGKLLTFKNTLRHMQAGEYDEAANGMAASLWYRQVGRRGDDLVYMMRNGQEVT